MTAEEFKAARRHLGLSRKQLASLMPSARSGTGHYNPGTVTQKEIGDLSITPVDDMCMRLLLQRAGLLEWFDSKQWVGLKERLAGQG